MQLAAKWWTTILSIFKSSIDTYFWHYLELYRAFYCLWNQFKIQTLSQSFMLKPTDALAWAGGLRAPLVGQKHADKCSDGSRARTHTTIGSNALGTRVNAAHAFKLPSTLCTLSGFPPQKPLPLVHLTAFPSKLISFLKLDNSLRLSCTSSSSSARLNHKYRPAGMPPTVASKLEKKSNLGKKS